MSKFKFIVVEDIGRNLNPIGFNLKSPILNPSKFSTEIIGRLLMESQVTAMYEVFEKDHTFRVKLNLLNYKRDFIEIWKEANPGKEFPWEIPVDEIPTDNKPPVKPEETGITGIGPTDEDDEIGDVTELGSGEDLDEDISDIASTFIGEKGITEIPEGKESAKDETEPIKDSVETMAENTELPDSENIPSEVVEEPKIETEDLKDEKPTEEAESKSVDTLINDDAANYDGDQTDETPVSDKAVAETDAPSEEVKPTEETPVKPAVVQKSGHKGPKVNRAGR